MESKAERIADRDHELAAFEPLGVAELRRRQRHRLVDAQQRQIGIRIVANHAGAQILAVGGGHIDARGAAAADAGCAGDVAVGEDQAVRRDDDARAGAAAFAAVLVVDLAAADGERHDGRADAVDHVDNGARISVEQRLIFVRYGRLCPCGGRAIAAQGMT